MHELLIIRILMLAQWGLGRHGIGEDTIAKLALSVMRARSMMRDATAIPVLVFVMRRILSGCEPARLEFDATVHANY